MEKIFSVAINIINYNINFGAAAPAGATTGRDTRVYGGAVRAHRPYRWVQCPASVDQRSVSSRVWRPSPLTSRLTARTVHADARRCDDIGWRAEE